MSTRLLLAGGGHVQLAVLGALARARPAGVKATLLLDSDRLFYSGMLPGWMAGHYRLDQLTIPLAPMAARAGVRLLVDPVESVVADKLSITTRSGERHGADLLSLATGGLVAPVGLGSLGDRLLRLRPVHDFVVRWPEIVAAARPGFRLAVAGGGAGGVELALAAAHRLGRGGATVTLFAGARGLLPGHGAGARRHVLVALGARGVRVEATRADADTPCDMLIAATGTRPPAWLADAGLALDAAGFIAVDRFQRSVSHPHVLAAGDLAGRADRPVPHSGLEAVRAGPVVAHNLLALLQGGRLRDRPAAKPTLYLLATRPGHAIASGRTAGRDWSSAGAPWWWLKDRIDRRYVLAHRVTGGHAPPDAGVAPVVESHIP